MKLNFSCVRMGAFSILVGVFVAASIRSAVGRLETIEQARADQKLFATEMEMLRESNDPSANDPATLKKLGALKLDHVHWANTNVEAVLADLTARSKEADPDHVGLHFVVHFPADRNQKDKLGRTMEDNVCVVLSGKTSVYELLGDISEQTNLAFRVQKGTVLFRLWEPGDSFSVPLVE
jgi:hypothetical protein